MLKKFSLDCRQSQSQQSLQIWGFRKRMLLKSARLDIDRIRGIASSDETGWRERPTDQNASVFKIHPGSTG
jgi:hypothetical protein